MLLFNKMKEMQNHHQSLQDHHTSRISVTCCCANRIEKLMEREAVSKTMILMFETCWPQNISLTLLIPSAWFLASSA